MTSRGSRDDSYLYHQSVQFMVTESQAKRMSLFVTISSFFLMLRWIPGFTWIGLKLFAIALRPVGGKIPVRRTKELNRDFLETEIDDTSDPF